MGLLFAILLLGAPLAAAIYDLLKTGDGTGQFKLGELVGISVPSGALAKSVKPAPVIAPVKPQPTVVPSSSEPPSL